MGKPKATQIKIIGKEININIKMEVKWEDTSDERWGEKAVGAVRKKNEKRLAMEFS